MKRIVRKEFVFVGLLVIVVALSGGSKNVKALRDEPVRMTHVATTSEAVCVPGQLLVRFQPGVSVRQMEQLSETLPIHELSVVQGLGVHLFRVPVGQERSLSLALSRLPTVRYAEPDYLYSAASITKTPNDRYYHYQWHYGAINLPAAWNITTGSNNIVVALLDSGVDLQHPDLAAHIVPGYDFINNDATPMDDNGHGTAIAGIIGAVTNNSTGVAGVAWQVKLMPVKVLNQNGIGATSGIISGLNWAVTHGAKVINMSLGGTSHSQAFQDAIDGAYRHGVTIIAASGNSYGKGNPVFYPAAYHHVIAVAAVGDQNEHASYSETGSYVDIAAPGGNASSNHDNNQRHWIWSTYLRSKGSAYIGMTGTSLATPHIAGVVTLLLSVNPSLTPAQIEAALTQTATDLGQPGRDNVFGFGLVNAVAAVEHAQSDAKPDAFEPDNSPAAAHWLAINGVSQSHNFYRAGDRDWLKFYARRYTVYHAETFALGSKSDTVLTLFDTDGSTVLARNDNCTVLNRLARPDNEALRSCLTWTAPADKQVYLSVSPHSDTANTGANSGYKIKLSATNTVKPTPTTEPSLRGVCLYTEVNFQGQHACFTASTPDLANSIIKRHTASSVRIVGAYITVLHAWINYKGPQQLLRADSPNLAKTGVGNNAVSSLQVWHWQENYLPLVWRQEGKKRASRGE